MARTVDRVVLIVLDSAGCGAAPDAADYGDEGANTLANCARALGGLALPGLGALGLGNLTGIAGVPPVAQAEGAYGRMRQVSAGKDTTTGHWEMAGLVLERPFRTFPGGLPADLLARFARAIGRGVLGGGPASGTVVLDDLGEQHLASGRPIVYTSADSVFQIAAHASVVPLAELYRYCEAARPLCDEFGIARVIARPFVGAPGAFRRTYDRRDFSTPPPAETVLDRIAAAGLAVVGIGKIADIFSGRGITDQVHSEGNADGMARTLTAVGGIERGLVFVNLVDFDMLYGHRRDVKGYGAALQQFDAFVPRLRAALGPRDLALVTADHGNDPTFRGTDHTREDVPILVFGATDRRLASDLGVRAGFYDVAQSLCEAFDLAPWVRGRSFFGQATA